MPEQCVWHNNHASPQGRFFTTNRRSESRRTKQLTNTLYSAVFCQLVSQLQPSQLNKASADRHRTTQTGATAPSNGQGHSHRQLRPHHKPRKPKHLLCQQPSCCHRVLARGHRLNHHQSHSKTPPKWLWRLGRLRFQASDSLSS
jgi:hypothetical protein